MTFRGLIIDGHVQSQVRSNCQVGVYMWLNRYKRQPDSYSSLDSEMTAADAVETSVTTINSLSQDFTNLDDQPSRTLTDTPGFKPFTL